MFSDILIVATFLFSLIFAPSSSVPHNSATDFILLGLDRRHDRLESTTATDTIIYASYRPDSNTLNTISLPRDIWYQPYQQKINQFYGRYHSLDFTSLKSDYTKIVGQDIDNIIVIDTDIIASLIDAIGYIDVYNPESFRDDQYPNPEYITNPAKPIYITVSYPQGWLRLDSSSVIPFLRSRKSLSGGTDLGRIGRQQILINHLIDLPKSSRLPFLISSLPKLISIYQQLETDLTQSQLLGLLTNYYQSPGQFKIRQHTLPVGTTKYNGLIYHPQAFYNPQWVFLPSDPDFTDIHQYISTSFTSQNN